MAEELVYGLDFGTSNTSLAVASRGQAPTLCRIDPDAQDPHVLPTQVYFGRGEKNAPRVSFGTQAFRELMTHGVRNDGRFLFELKAVMGLPVRSTRLQGRVYSMADLVATVIRFVKENADRALGQTVTRVVCGRPVVFSTDPEVDARAQETLGKALEIAGFAEHDFALEPVAADMERGTSTSGTTLTVDIGGGTLDVSIVRRAEGRAPEVLAVSGKPEAGRNVDRRLVYERLLEPFGRDLTWADGQKIPEWVLTKVGAWSEFHLLAESDDLKRALARCEVSSGNHPTVVSLKRYFLERHGYSFLREVEARKIALSNEPETKVRFVGAGFIVNEPVKREDLGGVLEPLALAVDACVDETLARAKLTEGQIDAVERIGGSSRIPAVYDRLAKRFGPEKVRGEGSLTAVALGLAEIARRKWLA